MEKQSFMSSLKSMFNILTGSIRALRSSIRAYSVFLTNYLSSLTTTESLLFFNLFILIMDPSACNSVEGVELLR